MSETFAIGDTVFFGRLSTAPNRAIEVQIVQGKIIDMTRMPSILVQEENERPEGVYVESISHDRARAVELLKMRLKNRIAKRRSEIEQFEKVLMQLGPL